MVDPERLLSALAVRPPRSPLAVDRAQVTATLLHPDDQRPDAAGRPRSRPPRRPGGCARPAARCRVEQVLGGHRRPHERDQLGPAARPAAGSATARATSATSRRSRGCHRRPCRARRPTWQRPAVVTASRDGDGDPPYCGAPRTPGSSRPRRRRRPGRGRARRRLPGTARSTGWGSRPRGWPLSRRGERGCLGHRARMSLSPGSSTTSRAPEAWIPSSISAVEGRPRSGARTTVTPLASSRSATPVPWATTTSARPHRLARRRRRPSAR